MKNKHRIKQGLSLLLAGGIALTNLGAALPAFAEDAPATPETAEATTPETAEANVPTPNLSQITENLYDDLPDAPTGSYLGSMGLPVATGETKIGISAWVSDLYDGVDAHMDADALNADENTVTIGKTPGTDYAIVPLLAQVEYPADGAVSEIILPDGVELLSYRSTDYEPIPADDREQAEILHQTYSEQSAAATGLYVKAFADFTAQLVYTDSDGSSQSKSIQVQISEDAAPTQMYADTGDDSIAAYAAGPTPPYATGKITSIAKEGGTWLIWFNGQEAYCCSHGLNGQPKGCPTYSFSHVSRLEPGQYTPGNHYANQVNIWGGLGQLSLDMLDDRPVVASLEDDPEGGEEQPDILGSLYDETQQWIMENYPDSYAAQTYIASAEELVNGTDAQSGENGYYTYIYNPPAGYAWQVVALVGEEIAGGTEIPDVPSVPEPKYYSAAWTAPAQTAGGSFDLTFTVNTDKYQLNTLEKVDGAVITVTPSRTGGSVDGGSWQMTPAGAQTITTSGHTQDDSFHLNGGDGSATWTVHYEVSKSSTSTLSGQEGPFASQAEADAAAEAAKNAAIGQLQNEAQGMVDAAIASARARLANITFAYDEITIPHGFDATPGALGIQLLGLVVVDAYVLIVMFLIFKIIDKTIGLRVPAEVEIDGLDIHEHGLASAYAGFAISDANSAAMVPNENTDLGEDDASKASAKQIDAAVPVVREAAVIHDGIYDTGMHKVSIIAKLSKFDQLKSALNDLGVTGMTVTQVMGCGIQKGTPEKYRGVPVDSTLLPKIKVEVIVSKISVDSVVEAAKKALYTGHIGDGKIFVYNVTRVVKIRTGEEDFAALQDVE